MFSQPLHFQAANEKVKKLQQKQAGKPFVV